MCTLHALNFFILFTVPGPPASVAVLDRTVIWQPPQSPNGKLTGYIIRVYSAGNIGQARTINVGVNPLYYQLMTDNLPAGNNLLVQVIIIVLADLQLLTGMILLGSWKDCSWSR